MLPTRAEWDEFQARGGADGSSFSPDWICGVQIGGTNEYPPLAADLHDFRYWRGGDDDDRLRADVEFWVRLRAAVDEGVTWWPRQVWRAIAAHRCLVYFRAVEKFGSSHWRWIS